MIESEMMTLDWTEETISPSVFLLDLLGSFQNCPAAEGEIVAI